METPLATIMVTAAMTAAVIGLGDLVWAIAQLKRRVSRLEVLCSGYETQFQGVYNEFDNRSRNHDDNLKQTENSIRDQMESVWRKFEENERTICHVNEETNRRIDRNQEEIERNLDRRFDSVYRKIYSSKLTAQSAVETY